MTTETSHFFLAAQQYPWWQRVRQAGEDWASALPSIFSQLKQAGIAGWEPMFQQEADVQPVAALLQQHGLTMRSFYVGGQLHTDGAAQTIARVLAIARAAGQHGAQIAVVNPDPIRWGGPENKTDAELRAQAQALDTLGRELRALGLTLAYHTHDAEMRAAAREFHHMLLATDPQHVSLCLDAHWIYRGAGDSELALRDITSLYAGRVCLIHLRQSRAGIWSEVFEAGDIDYAPIAALLRRAGRSPLLVLEQAHEQGTPATMPPVEAYRRGRRFAEQVFAQR